MTQTTAARALPASPFDELYESYADRVYSYCHRILRCPEDAADATQTTFVNLLRRAEDGRPVIGLLPDEACYVFTVARNACFDLKRKSKRVVLSGELGLDYDAGESAFGATPAPNAPENAAMASADRELLAEGLRELTERHRHVLVLRDVCDYTYEEIAAELGVNTNAVAQLLHRARARLARVLEPHRATLA